jgi:hypothetical protein
MLKDYMMIDGKVYEVLEKKGWGGYPVCRLCPDLKEIPEDKPLKAEVVEESEPVDKPKRGRRKA